MSVCSKNIDFIDFLDRIICIIICYKIYIMCQHWPCNLQSMPGHCEDVMPEFTEWL